MRILALETSGMAGSIAVLEGHRVLVEQELDPAVRTARTLAPAIRNLLGAVGWQPAEVQLVAVTTGPGSFTGLRIGVMTAKTFAYATGAAVIGVNTLAAIALPVTIAADRLWVVLNAERDQLFAAAFRPSVTGWTVDQPTRIVDREEWLAELACLPAEDTGGDTAPVIAVTGSGLTGRQARIPHGVVLLDESTWQPRASAVGRLGLSENAAGHRSDWWSLVPRYFRESAAEEKARGAGSG